MTAEVVTPDEVAADESNPRVVRRVVFETANAVMVQSTITGGTISGWHHHGDRHVDGYLVDGAGAVEYGPEGTETRESRAGECLSIAPGTLHRDVSPDGEATVVLMCFVGSGPVVVYVAGPGAD